MLSSTSFTPKESEIYEWTRDLIHLRKGNAALKYGTTITLWSSDLVYAFLRIATDDVALVVINNDYMPMTEPVRLQLNPSIIPQRVIKAIPELRHWKSGETLAVIDNEVLVTMDGKAIDIFCVQG